jgi:hypothetical protein
MLVRFLPDCPPSEPRGWRASRCVSGRPRQLEDVPATAGEGPYPWRVAANPRAEWWTTSDVAAYFPVQVATVNNYRKRDRMYETMVYWETAFTGDDQPAVVRDYARIWQAADKVVYSSTLDAGLQRADPARAGLRKR